MRRSVSILMLLLWWLAPLSALLPGTTDAQLPACCRRNGVHHCAMAGAIARSGQDATGRQVAAPAQCPLYHQVLPTTSGVFALLVPEKRTAPFSAPVRVMTQSLFALVHTNEHAGRGPPIAA